MIETALKEQADKYTPFSSMQFNDVVQFSADSALPHFYSILHAAATKLNSSYSPPNCTGTCRLIVKDPPNPKELPYIPSPAR